MLTKKNTLSKQITSTDSYKILLVDDRPENLLTLENIIEQDGRIVYKASSGNEALKIALNEPVDLVLLDVQMPDMDGYEVADFLRLNPKTKNIPIIFVSAVSRNEKGPVGKFEEGTVDFLFKPLDISETKTKISLYEKISKLSNERKMYQEKMEQMTKEMDQFVYIVSHDIKAPIRAIDNLITWMEEDLAGNTNQNLTDNFSLLKNRVLRMQKLLDGVTEYSRVGRINESREQVSINHLVQYIIETLNPSSEFKINVQTQLPVIFTEKTKLLKVFTHLINNAIIHHHEKEGVVDISFTEEATAYKFTVTDNGPGIKPQHHEKVFEIFHTLQSKDKHDTAGVGLSIVKKVVEAAGQKVWFDPNVSYGTAVHFTWPK